MTAIPQYPVLTIEEYFELEAHSNVRHEYDNGLTYAMAGASEAHVLITTNLVVTVACGERLFEKRPQSGETLLNPSLIIEVLSDSTEPYDKHRKRWAYQRIPSLMDYLLIRQDRVHVTHDTRQDDDWYTRIYTDRGDVIALPAIGCVLRLVDIYDDVELSG